jgi:voltage-gated potassium channel
MSAITNFREQEGLQRWEKWTTWPLLVAGLLFLVVILLPLATPLPATTVAALEWSNWILWGIFAVDYVFRLWLAMHRWHFVKTHVVDLFVVAVPALRFLTILRLASVLLVFLRRSREVPYFVLPLYVAGFTAILIAVSAVLVYDTEARGSGSPISTLGDAVWWAFTTVTTVGYGDTYPVTPIGRTLGVFLMLSGITLLGSVTASAAAWLTNSRRASEDEVTNAALLTELRDLRREVAEFRSSNHQGSSPT